MALKGQRVFLCAECDQRTYFFGNSLSNRTRNRCRFCGSHALDPISVGAIEQQATRNEAIVFDGLGEVVAQPGKDYDRKRTDTARRS